MAMTFYYTVTQSSLTGLEDLASILGSLVNKTFKPRLVVHAYHLNSPEAEVEGLLQVKGLGYIGHPELQIDTVSKKQMKKQVNRGLFFIF